MRDGFTLIEVVVVIAIIGLVASFAMPAMMDLSGDPDAGDLEPVRALLLESRQVALRGAVVDVSIVPTSGRYRVLTRFPDQDATVRRG